MICCKKNLDFVCVMKHSVITTDVVVAKAKLAAAAATADRKMSLALPMPMAP